VHAGHAAVGRKALRLQLTQSLAAARAAGPRRKGERAATHGGPCNWRWPRLGDYSMLPGPHAAAAPAAA
jgi:hypothetical protein